MKYIITVLVSFFASTVGSICGIGGGVIIKPVLDATGAMPVNTINFLSGCTVLSMSVISVFRKLKSRDRTEFDSKTALALAAGAVIGGILGKSQYQQIISSLSDTQRVGAVQAAVLLVITFGSLLYTINKEKIKTKHVSNYAGCVGIGCILGAMSAFLGIGGGPINLVVLYFFFSMQTKQAALYSLYIIMFSQISSLVSNIISGTVPEFSIVMIVLMVLCGTVGGLVGARVNKKLSEKNVDTMFKCLMVLIMVINVYNIVKYI